ncbi:MAG: hypothetical protein ACR2QM_12460 [Longimicrobiales bacterium]
MRMRRRPARLVLLAAVPFLCLPVGPGLSGQVPFTEESSMLPDGTLYRIRVPDPWNGTLLRDLDYAGRADNAFGLNMLERGYAMAGTQRHELRAFQYDPQREITNLDLVLDRFEDRFTAPDRVIQYGCSGGGHVTIAVAEDYSSRIDGAIALGAHHPVWLMNTFLDGWFALQVLIAPELPVVDLPFQSSGGTAHGVEGEIPTRWREAINGAQATPEGRARIALAATLGQWPAWSTRLVSMPELDDPYSLQHSLYHNLYDRYAANPGGEARIMFESAAQGRQLSWNESVDYRAWFEDGNPAFRAAVARLYQDAGLDLATDLDRLNEAPRVTASPHALEFWGKPGRNTVGVPKIPLLRLHEVGDFQVPLSLVSGYDDLIEANGKQDLYRTAFVEAPTHCGFNVAEAVSAVETMMVRLDAGEWPETGPEALNRVGEALGTDDTPRFIDPTQYRPAKYNRVWVPN